MGLLSYLQRQGVIDEERKAREEYQRLLGQSPVTAMAPQEGPIQPGESLPSINQTTPGSGLLGGPSGENYVSPQEFIGRTAGMPGNLGPNAINAMNTGLLGGAAKKEGFKNVQQDGAGRWWGVNPQGKVQMIPMQDEGFFKYQTVQSTDRHGMPMTQLVSPQLMGGNNPQARITVGSKMRKFAEGELLSAGYANRMARAGENLSDFEAKGIMPTNISDALADKIPAAGNFLVSGEYQQYLQQTNDWIRAKLRKESGAQIAKEEWIDEFKTYFPVPGDSAETLRAKAESRAIAEENMRVQSQGAYEKKYPRKKNRKVKRTGTHNGRKVIEYSDGTIDYAD